MKNYFKTTVLMVGLTLFMMFIGGLWAGEGGMILLFLVSMVMNLAMYWFSDKIALAMHRAKPLSREEAPNVYRTLDELTQWAQLPMPRVYLIDNDAPNAFATGRNPQHSAVAVTRGLLQLMQYEELKGVLAHELAHIKNRDCLISTVAAAMAGVIMMIAHSARWGLMFTGFGGRDRGRGGDLLGYLFMIIVAPLAAMLIQMAISRSREYGADATGASFAGQPHGLANALLKLEQGAKLIPMETSPATSHLFIVNPLSGKGFRSLFSTHPPIEERVRRLRELSNF